jgi:hypothetical protein
MTRGSPIGFTIVPAEHFSMRKLLLSLICLFGVTGLVFGAEVTLVKHNPDKKELTVKDGDKEVVLKYNDKTKVTFIDREMGTATEGTLEAALKLFNTQRLAGKLKFETVTDKDTVVEFKIKGKKKN